MGALLRRSAWGLAVLAWVLLAMQVLSARAIVERETISSSALRAMRLPGRQLPTAGGHFHVVTDGKAGRYVILVHGLGGSTADWEERVLRRLGHEFRVIAIDLYGFGYSARGAELEYDLAAWSKQIDVTMKAYGIRRVTLVGQSLGAAVVAEYAARERRRVERLVLLSPLDPQRWTAPIPYAQLLQQPILGEILISQFDHMTRDAEYSASHHARARHVAGIAGTRQALLRCLRTPPAIQTLPALYAKIRAPTLVMRGEQDQLVDPQVAKQAASSLRRGQLTLVPKAGHLLARDQPDVVADTITRFVKARPKSRGKRNKAKPSAKPAPTPPATPPT